MSSATESRADRFARELADLKISDPAAGHPWLWQRLGAALMAAGVVLGVAAYLISHRTNLLSPGDGALDASSATVASSGRADS